MTSAVLLNIADSGYDWCHPTALVLGRRTSLRFSLWRHQHRRPPLGLLLAAEVEADAIVGRHHQTQLVTLWRFHLVAYRPQIKLSNGLRGKWREWELIGAQWEDEDEQDPMGFYHLFILLKYLLLLLNYISAILSDITGNMYIMHVNNNMQYKPLKSIQSPFLYFFSIFSILYVG